MQERLCLVVFFFFQAEDGIRDHCVTGVQTCALPIFRIMQEHSRKEPGCLMYIGHQSSEDPRKFMFYEQYKDQAALEAHRGAPYFKQYEIGRASCRERV